MRLVRLDVLIGAWRLVLASVLCAAGFTAFFAGLSFVFLLMPSSPWPAVIGGALMGLSAVCWLWAFRLWVWVPPERPVGRSGR